MALKANNSLTKIFFIFFTFLGPHEISTGLPIQSTKCEVHIKNVASQCVWGMVFYFREGIVKLIWDTSILWCNSDRNKQ